MARRENTGITNDQYSTATKFLSHITQFRNTTLTDDKPRVCTECK
jgi:hypothetical protein